MSINDKKRFAKSISVAFNQGDIDALDRLIAVDCVDHTAVSGQPSGLSGLKQTWAQLRYTFPDTQLVASNLTVDQDSVALQVNFQAVSSTGKLQEATMVEVFRLTNGKAVDVWNILRWN